MNNNHELAKRIQTNIGPTLDAGATIREMTCLMRQVRQNERRREDTVHIDHAQIQFNCTTLERHQMEIQAIEQRMESKETDYEAQLTALRNELDFLKDVLTRVIAEESIRQGEEDMEEERATINE